MEVGSTVLFQPDPRSRGREEGEVVEVNGEQLVIERERRRYRVPRAKAIARP